MLSLPPAVKIFVASAPVDLRKGFDGLSGVVRNILEGDPLSGHLFVFFNKRRNLAKILWWNHSGFWLLYTRLERGTFTIPVPETPTSPVVRMRSSELALILDGIDLRGAKRKRRYDFVRETE